jgi:DNA-binding LacI/PurR family transcriptional regulator
MKRLGHRRIALPGAEANARPPGPRERALAGLGLSAVCTGRRPTGFSPQQFGRAGAAAVARAVEAEGVTAACFLDDEDAAFAMRELKRLGFRVPEDLSVTGFDGMPFTAALTPQLTTLRIPVARMVERVHEILSGESEETVHRFGPRLIRGESLGPAPGTVR